MARELFVLSDRKNLRWLRLSNHSVSQRREFGNIWETFQMCLFHASIASANGQLALVLHTLKRVGGLNGLRSITV